MTERKIKATNGCIYLLQKLLVLFAVLASLYYSLHENCFTQCVFTCSKSPSWLKEKSTLLKSEQLKARIKCREGFHVNTEKFSLIENKKNVSYEVIIDRFKRWRWGFGRTEGYRAPPPQKANLMVHLGALSTHSYKNLLFSLIPRKKIIISKIKVVTLRGKTWDIL